MSDRIETEHGIFTSNTITGETAEEIYQKWLASQNTVTNPSTEYVKSNLELQRENEKLKAQLEASTQNQEFLEACLMEMAQIVYA